MTTPERTRLASERPHILIVTSDEGLRTFLAEGLLYGGFWTSSVASGMQALEVFRLRTFDAVLLDLEVQGFGGLEIARRLRGTARSAFARTEPSGLTDVPIVAITQDAQPGIRELVDEIGIDDLLSPPIEISDLVPYLFNVVDEWRQAHPGRLFADQASREM
jgi:CheY-like chemotaxis protein